MILRNRSALTSLEHPVPFVLVLCAIVASIVSYGANMLGWRNSPEFGWRTMYDSGPNTVAMVLESGAKAGLRVGDRIAAINGKPYETFDELYFSVRNREPGSSNSYSVKRNGETVEISITTGTMGLAQVLWRSGPLFIIGSVYCLIGLLVYLMKTGTEEAMVFLVMTSLIGIKICYSGPSDLMQPLWLFDVRLFIDVIFPAAIVHLLLIFPRRRAILIKWPKLWALPYLASIIHFTAYEIAIQHYWDPAPWLDLLGNIYESMAIIWFLLSLIWNLGRDPSVLIQRQSEVIVLGIALGFGIPIFDSILRFHWNSYLFSDPTVGYAFFLTLFPLSIGYTIVKYDLFAIDVLIKRTYGYVATTGMVAAGYFLFVLISNRFFQQWEMVRSPLFPIIFAVTVAFAFDPLRRWVQRSIDRIFFRLGYDYPTTIRKISESMRSLLKLDAILDSFMQILLGVLLVDTAIVMLLGKDGQAYECVSLAGAKERRQAPMDQGSHAEGFAHNGERRSGLHLGGNAAASTGPVAAVTDCSRAEIKLEQDHPLIQCLTERMREVTVYEVYDDPLFKQNRTACLDVFEQLQATLVVPLIYENRLSGLLSLGRKKSGKFYRQEDVNLLNVLANQGAVAIENARLLEEVVEKERMQEELHIAHELQASMLPAVSPELAGFEIAAASISAREVGGDFYDFIKISEGRLGLVIGDVTGKSVSGALVMAASRSVFRMLSEESIAVGEIMNRANRRIKGDVSSGMFVALLYTVLSEDRTLSLCSAGQTQPILFSVETGDTRLVETEGDNFPLGILPAPDYQETQLHLTPGDRLVLYTDGVVEAMNSDQELFGFDRLLETVRMSGSVSAEMMVQQILSEVDAFAGAMAQHDDLTVVVVSACA